MAKQHLKHINRSCWLLLAAFVGLTTGAGWQIPSAPTQAQVAYRFLREVLRAEYPTAYRRLAPEVRATLPPAAFATAVRPLRVASQQRGTGVELYKFGTRLGVGGGRGQWFYSFYFASDSLQKPPPVLLEVTFRDTTARQVLGFRVRGR